MHADSEVVLKLFVVVRSDLTPAQQAVQAAHGVAEWLLHQTTVWRNETLILKAARSQDHLLVLMGKLAKHQISHIIWREADLNNEVTAIATADPNAEVYISRLHLLLS